MHEQPLMNAFLLEIEESKRNVKNWPQWLVESTSISHVFAPRMHVSPFRQDGEKQESGGINPALDSKKDK